MWFCFVFVSVLLLLFLLSWIIPPFLMLVFTVIT
jgi:hypothetical protein